MKSIPQDVSESTRRRNPHLYLSGNDVESIPVGSVCLAKPPKRIRQSTKPLMNKLELEFYAYLCAFFPSCKFHAQSIRFKLGNGIWYKPDFVCFSINTCWEVKGPHAFRGGFENLKVTAHQYPDFKWVLAWKQDGGWKEQIVLP